MKRTAWLTVVVTMAMVLTTTSEVSADDRGDLVKGDAQTTAAAVRVTVTKSGGVYAVGSVSGGSTAEAVGCSWSLIFAPDLNESPYGTDPGPKPHPDAQFALLLCDGTITEALWVAPDDVVDLDALARGEAQRYVEDVLVPTVRIGVNPAARGLVGLRSWFWIEGFTGSVTAPPIAAFGLTIDVRMSSGAITWDFGDGTVESGDLGRAYPVESTVQHAHQRDGEFTVTATIDLVPEYRVNGGPWLPLPGLQAVATTQHQVQERQAVITDT